MSGRKQDPSSSQTGSSGSYDTRSFHNMKTGKYTFKFLNEDVYSGDWLKDLPHGLGTYEMVANRNGELWVYRQCQFLDGEPINGTLLKYTSRSTSNEYYRYQGDFEDWCEHGRGRVIDSTTTPPNTFQGLFKLGKWVEGALTTEHGYRYEGKFDSNGMKYHDMNGKLCFPPKSNYKEFQGVLEQGRILQGEMKYRASSSRDVYIGTFKDGMHLLGLYIYILGRVM